MASPSPPHQGLHFILVPLLSPGHFIPMIDMAKLLASRGVTTTAFVTPLIAARYGRAIDRASESGRPIRVVQLLFPAADAGLPEGCESADTLPPGLWGNFFNALEMWLVSLEHFVEQMDPFPCCMITDRFTPRMAETAKKFGIPRIIFDGMGCLTVLCSHHIQVSQIHESVPESESFVVPGLPDKIELTKAQLPHLLSADSPQLRDYRDRLKAADDEAYGLVINSFEELEQNYIDELRNLNGDKIWCIGPLSLCNRDISDMAQRGNKAAIDEDECLKWLDKQEPGSVVYACLGSLSSLTLAQLAELGLALEVSNRPFIWVLRAGQRKEETEKWILENGLERRTQGRGLLIRGWAPQVLVLSHRAIGAFLTHCGWNSTLEGVCSGVPLITWPLFAEQFFNEKLVVQILGIGVSVGSRSAMQVGEEKEVEVSVKREAVVEAIGKVMDGNEEGEERKRRAREVREMARKAIEEGGSSYLNLTLLIQDIMQQKHASSKQLLS